MACELYLKTISFFHFNFSSETVCLKMFGVNGYFEEADEVEREWRKMNMPSISVLSHSSSK